MSRRSYNFKVEGNNEASMKVMEIEEKNQTKKGKKGAKIKKSGEK